MVKKKGAISTETGVKPDIIKFILENNGPVKESQIREHLKKKNEKIDQGNINRYLHNLSEEHACIELISPVKKGLPNKWDITKVKHLKNIKDIFKNIKLNEYEKSLIIILRESGVDIKTPTGLVYYILLLLSVSFFNACIDTGIKTLRYRVWKYYRYNEGFERDQRIKKLLNECLAEYSKKNPGVEMSELGDVDETLDKDIPVGGYYSFRFVDRDPVEEMSEKTIQEESEEIDLKMFEEEFSGLSKEEYVKIKKVELLLKQQRLSFAMRCTNLLFDHYYYQDILDDIASPDEIEFARKTKENHEKNPVIVDFIQDLKLISKLIFKYKQPSIYGVYYAPEDVFNGLIEFFGFQRFLPQPPES